MRTIVPSHALLAAAIGCLVAGVVLLLAPGCAGTDAAIKAPLAVTTTPKVQAGDNAVVGVDASQITEVLNQLRQEVNALRVGFNEVKGNVSQQVSQYDLSAQQSDLVVKLVGILVCVFVGLILIALAVNAPADPRACTVMLMVGIAMTVAPLLHLLGGSGGAVSPAWEYLAKALPYIVGLIVLVAFKDWLSKGAQWIGRWVGGKATERQE